MIALGCASEIALAAASNSASCAPLATSARDGPFHRQRNGPDDVSLRVELFPDARHPIQSDKIVPSGLSVEVDAQHRRRLLLQPFFPGLQSTLATDRRPSLRMRRRVLRNSHRRARRPLSHHEPQRLRSRPSAAIRTTSLFRTPRAAGAATSVDQFEAWFISACFPTIEIDSLRPTSIDPSAVR